MMPASVPLSVMLKLGKVITPKIDFVTLTLEEFSVTDTKDKKSVIQITILFGTSNMHNFRIRRLWSIKSNALR